MRKLICIIILLVTALVTEGCSVKQNTETPANQRSSSSVVAEDDTTANTDKPKLFVTPTVIVLNYFTALEQGDIPGVKLCLSKASLTKLSDDNLSDMAEETGKSRKNFQILKETVKGNDAKLVYLYNQVSDDSLTEDVIYLIKENDQWKINLAAPKPELFGGNKKAQ